jgi:pimeloyl-ACP methyl ester carboxylesterase
MDVYCIPGLGTDRRLFSRLPLERFGAHVLEWPAYGKDHDLRHIATVLADRVDTSRPHVLVGVSMGGMVAQEMAALTGPSKVVLISSWTGPHEMPPHVRLARALRLYTLVNETTMRGTWPLKQWLVGMGNKEVDRLLFDMACAQTALRVRQGMRAVLHWKGSPWKGQLVRIHGDRDLLMPLRFPVDHVVRGGTHSMVIHKPHEVAQALAQALERP